jgi:hypothetical protein
LLRRQPRDAPQRLHAWQQAIRCPARHDELRKAWNLDFLFLCNRDRERSITGGPTIGQQSVLGIRAGSKLLAETVDVDPRVKQFELASQRAAQEQTDQAALANLKNIARPVRAYAAAQSIGMASAAFDAALAYAKRRRTFGRPIIEHQAVSFQIADMATSLQAAELMVLHAARLRDAGRPSSKQCSMAKLFAADVAEQVCNNAIQIHGGYGYLDDCSVGRIYRDVRVCKIYEGTSEIQRLVIGRHLALEQGFDSVGG